jgi:polar amino acid transport system substrate-binding protein
VQLQTIFTSFTRLELVLIILFSLLFVFYLYKKIKPKQRGFSTGNEKLPAIKKSFEGYKEAILILSEKGEVLFSNKACADLLGLNEGFDREALEHATVLKVSGDSQVGVFDFLESYRLEADAAEELAVRAKIVQDESEIPIKLFLGRVEKPSLCYVVAFGDISMETEITTLRQRDNLTHLPNQSRAINDLGMVISKMHSHGKQFALILISLDDFTEIRAMLGYHQTDSLISRIAKELQHIAKSMDSNLYHMMRNNFLLIVPDTHTATEAKELVSGIKNRLQASFDYSNSGIPLTFSAGISFFPQSGNNVDVLIDCAYKALSEAKEHGGGYVIADEEGLFSKDKLYETEIYSEMQQALKNGEFELYYQPLISIENEEIMGAEALVRWNHPTRGMISPVVFIPIAEKTGLIVDIDKFVIGEAIKQQKRWEIFKFKSIQMSINLSLRDIESEEIVDFIAKSLLENKVAPELIKFEITENSAMVNAQVTQKEFGALKKLGVELALDDFGTGYSSFSYLKDFSLDTLKIDRSFVTDMANNSEHQKLVFAMIELGHNFDLKVTAEGIEDRITFDLLKSYGCDIAQGYYFSKPLPVFEFQELIRRNLGEKQNNKE